MANDVKHLHMCLFDYWISSSVKCLLMSFAHFLIRFFSCLNFENSLYIYIFKVLVLTWIQFTHIFSLSVACFFYPLNRVFQQSKFLILMMFSLALFPCMNHAFGVMYLTSPPSQRFSSEFFCKSFIVLHFILHQ